MGYEVKEFTIGEILDTSIALTRGSLKQVALAMLLMLFPLLLFVCAVVAVIAFVAYGVGANPLSQEGLEVMFTHGDQGVLVLLAVLCTGLVGAFMLVIFPVFEGVLLLLVGGEYLDHQVSIKEAIKYALSKWWPLAKTKFLCIIVLMGVMVVPAIFFGVLSVIFAQAGMEWVGILLSVLVGLGAMLAFSYLLLMLFLTEQIVIFEDISGFAALKKSIHFMKGSLVKAFVVLLVAWVLMMMLGGLGNLIPFVPLALVISLGIQVVTYAFTYSLKVIFYFSCKSRKEGFDLEHSIESMEVMESMEEDDIQDEEGQGEDPYSLYKG